MRAQLGKQTFSLMFTTKSTDHVVILGGSFQSTCHFDTPVALVNWHRGLRFYVYMSGTGCILVL